MAPAVQVSGPETACPTRWLRGAPLAFPPRGEKKGSRIVHRALAGRAFGRRGCGLTPGLVLSVVGHGSVFILLLLMVPLGFQPLVPGAHCLLPLSKHSPSPLRHSDPAAVTPQPFPRPHAGAALRPSVRLILPSAGRLLVACSSCF